MTINLTMPDFPRRPVFHDARFSTMKMPLGRTLKKCAGRIREAMSHASEKDDEAMGGAGEKVESGETFV